MKMLICYIVVSAIVYYAMCLIFLRDKRSARRLTLRAATLGVFTSIQCMALALLTLFLLTPLTFGAIHMSAIAVQGVVIVGLSSFTGAVVYTALAEAIKRFNSRGENV